MLPLNRFYTGSSGYACAALYCLQRGEVLHRPLARVADALNAFTQGLAFDKQASKFVVASVITTTF
jgi:hypothetical protein